MKKLLFAISFCAICAGVSPLPGSANTPYADIDDDTPEIRETAEPETDSTEEAAKLRRAGRDAFQKKDYAAAVGYYRQAADLGDAEAQFLLGNRYYNGQGVSKDKEQAFYWYEKAARQGNTDAQTLLGLCYLNGDGVKQNEDKGIYWLSLAADQGNASAKLSFGLCYIDGTGVSANAKHGFILVKDAAEHGLTAAQLHVGRFYCEGTGVEQDIEQGKKWFAKAAANTEEDYQEITVIAKEILDELNTVKAALAEAEELKQLRQDYLDAHESDDKETASAIRNSITSDDKLIDVLSSSLQNIPSTIMAAYDGDEQSAKFMQESRQALRNIRSENKKQIRIYKSETTGEIIVPAELYTNTKQYDNIKPYDAYTRGLQSLGQGDPKSYALLESSARRGCNHAKISLAWLIMPKGHPLAHDLSRSFVFEGKNLNEAERLQRYLKWMSSAAENGSGVACWELRNLYKEGKYVPRDSAKVFHYTKASAELKYPDAMFDLGTRYAQGIGCQKDRAAAVKWMKQAAHAGNADAQQWINDRRGRYVTATESYKISSAQALQEAKRKYPNVNTISDYRYDPEKFCDDRLFIGILSDVYSRGSGRAPMYTVSDGYGSSKFPYATNAHLGDIVLAGHRHGIELIDDRTRTRTVRKWQGPKIGGWEDLLK